MRFKWIIGLLPMLTACDEGRIYDEAVGGERGGLRVEVTVSNSSGANAWFEGYSLAVAGFSAVSEYAIISKALTVDDDGNCRVTLDGIPAEVRTVELCVIDRLRRKVATFRSVGIGDGPLEIISDGDDFSPESPIQSEIFNTTCVNCHGGANFAAAGLNLSEGRSFGELIGVQSVKVPEEMRVAPGNAEASVLYRILAGNASAGWNYDHSVEITASEKLELIKNWIKAQ